MGVAFPRGLQTHPQVGGRSCGVKIAGLEQTAFPLALHVGENPALGRYLSGCHPGLHTARIRVLAGAQEQLVVLEKDS